MLNTLIRSDGAHVREFQDSSSAVS